MCMKSINGPRWRKKRSNECDAATKLWADKLLILMSEMLHSIVKRSDALTRLFWCQNCCIRPWNNQIHWRGCFWCQNYCIWCRCHQMHWRLSDCQAAAPDRETVRCTLTVVCLTRTRWCWLCVKNMMSERLHLISNNQMHWRNCFLMSKKLHLTPNDWMHWRNCLLISEKLHPTSNDQMHWQRCLIVRLLHPTVIQSNARWRLSEFFVDWEFMREFVHKLDRKKNEKKNEIRFQIIQVNVVQRWSTFWLWKLFFFYLYVSIFQKISKFTFSSIENHFEIVFIAVSEKFVKFFSQLQFV